MEQTESIYNTDLSTEHYFDRGTGQIIVGRIALNAHLEVGGHPADINTVGELLVSDELDGLSADYYHPRTVSHWTASEAVTYADWLAGQVAKIEGRRKLTQPILRRGHIMGLGISPNQIVSPQRLKSLAELYQRVGRVEATTNRIFDEVSLEELVADLFELGRKLGRKPTEKDVNEQARQDKRYASSDIYHKRAGGLRAALDLAGWPDIYSWDLEDHLAHGRNFVRANEGLQPSQLAWDFLSRNKKGPSASILRYKFHGGFSEFKLMVSASLDKENQELRLSREEKMLEIQADIESDAVPQQLFDGVESEDEKILRHSKFLVLKNIGIPDNAELETQIKVCSTGLTERNFAASVKKINENSTLVTTADVEVAALYLGVFDYIWPLDTSVKSLRIIDDRGFAMYKKARRRKKTSRTKSGTV